MHTLTHTHIHTQTHTHTHAHTHIHTNIAVDVPDPTGKGGTTTTGNVAHALLSNEKIFKVLVSTIPEEFQKSLHECLTRLYVICKLYNSTYFINIEGFKDFCLETKLLLLRSFTNNNK